jgi:hypothetical protein
VVQVLTRIAVMPCRYRSRVSPTRCGFVAAEQGSLDAFDVGLEGWTSPDIAAKIIAPYVDAGLTWWIEAMGWWRGGVDATRERILAGPPR